ncbi:MAG: hypothetical protein JXA30_16810 [Deltaproteobacteria bacterium]|nr:hypothetical protein [Deltaproteobacteria bacterium]
MFRSAALISFVLSLIFVSTLFAQEQETGVEEGTGSEQPARAESESNVEVAEEKRVEEAPEKKETVCLLGLHTGIDESDAQTAADLVCKELRKNGVSVLGVERSAEGASAAYRIELRKLGDNVLIDLIYESPIGSPHDSRSTQLKSIEEVIVAAPRLAKALIRKEPMETTAEISTLVGDETRPYEKIYGEFFWGLGILGVAMPTVEIYAGFGFQLKVFYESSEYSIGVDIKGGGADQGEDDAKFFGMSVGARYFFSTANISPFIGGGLGFLLMEVTRDDGYDYYIDYEGTGLTSYLEAGVEFLRFHSSRLDLAVRFEAPFFSLEDEYYYSGPNSVGETRSRYVFPITLGLAYCW